MTKNYYLVKQSKSIQLGHLYEHLICLELMKIFQSNNLYLHADYDLVAKMYHGGMIYFEVTCYTENHPNIQEMLSKIKIDYEKFLESAISTIYAEDACGLELDTKEEIITLVDELHLQPWTSLDELGVVDANMFEDENNGIGFDKDGHVKLDTLIISCNYNHIDEDTTIIPLARQLLRIASANINDAIAEKYGLFSVEDDFKKVKTGHKLINISRVGYLQPDLEDCLDIAVKTFEAMKKAGAFNRYMEQLKHISYSKRPQDAPNFEKSYENTLVFLGSKGWKNIATKENMDKILCNFSIDIQYDK